MTIRLTFSLFVSGDWIEIIRGKWKLRLSLFLSKGSLSFHSMALREMQNDCLERSGKNCSSFFFCWKVSLLLFKNNLTRVEKKCFWRNMSLSDTTTTTINTVDDKNSRKKNRVSLLSENQNCCLWFTTTLCWPPICTQSISIDSISDQKWKGELQLATVSFRDLDLR